MNSRGFYSFYVFVLIVFVGMAIAGYFSRTGRISEDRAHNHIAMQMEIISSDLFDLGKACLKKNSFKRCQSLKLSLEGYSASLLINQCQEEACIVDVWVEKISPLSSLPLRYTKREIWNLKNLK